MGAVDNGHPEESKEPRKPPPQAGQPGELAGRQPVELASERANLLGPAPMEFMLQVREGLPMCETYFKLVSMTRSTFKIEVLAFARMGEQLFVMPFRTGDISLFVTQERMDAEVELVVSGLAKTLGIAVFTGKKEPISERAFKMFVEPA